MRDPLELPIVSRVRTALAIGENDYKANDKANNYNTEPAHLSGTAGGKVSHESHH